MSYRLLICMCMVLALSNQLILAQPPGGGDGPPTGGLRGDGVEVPSIEEIDLENRSDIDIDTQTQSIIATASAVDINALTDTEFSPEGFSEMMENFVVPEDWSQIAVSDQMPSRDDILAIQDQLPVDIDLDNLDIQAQSSTNATNAIIGYASTMLGLQVTPLYAGEYGSGELDSSAIEQETISEIYAQLGADMQVILSQADSLSGVTYWALLDDGLALIYTGDCDLDQCTIQQDMVQVEITNGSAGAYALYSQTVPTTTDAAKSLVQSTYPYLATLDLSETESDYGTAFFAFDIDMDNGNVTAYYAGVYGADSGQSIVYAVSGIGDAYINVLLGG